MTPAQGHRDGARALDPSERRVGGAEAPAGTRRMSDNFKLALLWLVGGSVAFVLALVWTPAVFVGDEILPSGHDSFYHARRILDAAADPGAFYQFDPRIRIPEGAWIPWPWGYDLGMAWLVRIFAGLLPGSEPIGILVYIPPLWVFVNVALLLAVASVIGLSMPLRLVAVACYTLSPLTQYLHGVGRVDHHFFEQTLTLGCLLAGLMWLARPDRRGRALAAGLLFGFAPAFHNGLFMLQAPLAGALTLLWLQGRLPDRGPVLGLVAGLLIGLATALLPADAMWAGRFNYYLLSLFHLYVGGAVALWLVLLVTFRFSIAALAGLTVLAAVLAVPLATELSAGARFVDMELGALQSMGETWNVFGQGSGRQLAWRASWGGYSGLVWLLPGVIVVCAWQAFRAPAASRVFFLVFCVFGGLTLLQQFRFHQLGSFALYLPLLLLADRWIPRGPRMGYAAVAVVFLLAYGPTPAHLARIPPPGFDAEYAMTRAIFGPLKSLCETAPGTVLAAHNDGHYIRFHTECSVVSNNMILSPQSLEKLAFTERLLAGSAKELRRAAPWARYLLVRRGDNVLDRTATVAEVLRENAGLRRELLLSGNEFPAGFELIDEVALPQRGPSGPQPIPIARLFRIEEPGGDPG